MPSPIIKPKSSHIRSYSYDAPSKSLTVEFHNGKSYTHVGVPSAVYSNMQKDWSAGKYYHAVVRRYPLAK